LAPGAAQRRERRHNARTDIPSTGTRNELFPGHARSGGSKQGAGAAFAIPETESASELSWAFFKE
jgi:hypothetical protein